MRARVALLACFIGLCACLGADEPGPKQSVSLSAPQKDFLPLEPILVRVAVDAKQSIPAVPGAKEMLRFEVKPTVKPRPNAKPLPVEANTKNASARIYDLLEWFQFPAEGAFTVQAVVTSDGVEQRLAPISVAIRRPDKKDPEWGPVDRLHHIPWSNYVTDAFCGDTFDVVKRWPDSKLAKYCHYWNGLHHQHKKEYDKAIASFQNVEKYPDFILRPHARAALNECVAAQRQAALWDEALREIGKSGSGSQIDRTKSADEIDALLKKIKEDVQKQQ